MSSVTSSTSEFATLAKAIDFIATCIETASSAKLFDETVAGRASGDRHETEFENFSRGAFPELQRQHKKTALRERYKERSFPADADRFMLGGCNPELGHVHLDFLKRNDGWVIERIWQCK